MVTEVARSLILHLNPSPAAASTPSLFCLRSIASYSFPAKLQQPHSSRHYNHHVAIHFPAAAERPQFRSPVHCVAIHSRSPASVPAPRSWGGRAFELALLKQSIAVLPAGGRRVECSTTTTTFVSNKEVELRMAISIKDSPAPKLELEALVEQLQVDGPMALKFALDGLKDMEPAETVELSVLICNDEYIQDLNKEWRGEDCPTDVLSFPQGQPPFHSSTLLLGDVIISMETAARQAEENGHTLLDEMRILLVHGVLHVLEYDHEEGPEAAKEMEDEESRILRSLGWKGKGLISASYGDYVDPNWVMGVHSMVKDSKAHDKRSKTVRSTRPPFRALFCDMDGTLLNSRSQVTEETALAIKEAISRGVKVIVATGKTRPAAMAALQDAGLVGEDGAVSASSPGVFVQGLLVYGQGGHEIHKEVLPTDICSEAFQFSLDHRRPLVGFSGDRIVTLFDHPDIDVLHTLYMEPKPEVFSSLEYLVNNVEIQKLLFIDTIEEVRHYLRPHWLQATKGRARIVQAIENMLEILPHGASKGKGVKLLLDHLRIDPDDVMAIGDGENDIEMLELVAWGVAMRNGSPQTLAVADAQVASNDENGVAEALERFLLT